MTGQRNALIGFASGLAGLFLVTVLGGATFGVGGGGKSPPTDTPAPLFTFQSATSCAGCHDAIYSEWSESWMRGAYVNAAFQADFTRWRTLAQASGEDPLDCLRCHAPAALMPLPAQHREALALEGVTCEVCHRTASVEWEDDIAHASLAPGFIGFDRTLGGPAPHPVAASAAFDDSSLCAMCHLDKRGDLFIERTYDEWRNGPWAAEGVGCTTCHMPSVSGPSATGGSGENHASHRFPGGHPGSPLLAGAATLEIVSIDDAVATFAVENVGVGHNLPTGGVHPTELALDVAILGADGARREVVRHSYKQIFLSANGAPAGPTDTVVSTLDTTLAPRERRMEQAVLPDVLPGDRLEARLVYQRYARASADLKANENFAAALAPVTLARCVFPLDAISDTSKLPAPCDDSP